MKYAQNLVACREVSSLKSYPGRKLDLIRCVCRKLGSLSLYDLSALLICFIFFLSYSFSIGCFKDGEGKDRNQKD